MKIAEEWDILMEQMKVDDIEFAKQSEVQCTSVYVATRHGTVEATEVYPRYKHKYFGSGRVTRKRLQELKDYIKGLERVIDNLYIHYKYKAPTFGGYSAAKPILDIMNGKDGFVFSCKTQADEVSAVMVKDMEEKKLHEANGGKFCKYCGKIINQGQEVSGVVIARQYIGMRATFTYCSDACHSHDQMAHEG
jgi:hypothetical protein